MINIKNLYYLGPDGSNCYSAVLKFLNITQINIGQKIAQKSIKFALNSLENDKNSMAILPIENSIEGLVRETIDNLIKLNDISIQIQGEVVLPINHLLLSKSKDIKTIKKIYSHPQALAQCSRYLFETFSKCELIEVSSTSYGAQKVYKENDLSLAAIANETCADIFHLNILASNINDEKENQTRFYILGRDTLEKNNTSKTAVIIMPKVNKAGTLCDILKIFANYEINLSYIDSRPSKKHLGEYMFFMELDGLKTEQKIQTAINELRNYVDFIKILGSYSVFNRSLLM